MVKFPPKVAAKPAPAAAAAPSPAPKSAVAAKPGLRPAGAAKPRPAPAAVHAHSKYAGVSTAKVSVEGNYIKPGTYIAQIEKVEGGTTQMSREDFVSVHLLILAADDSQLTALDQRMGGGVNAVGETASDFNKLSNVAFNQKMMAFAMCVSNMTQEEIQEAEIERGAEMGLKPTECAGIFIAELHSDEQPVAGRFVEVQVKLVKNAANKAVPDDEVTRDGIYGRVTYRRLIAASEIASYVEEDVLASRVPNLDELIAKESENGEEAPAAE